VFERIQALRAIWPGITKVMIKAVTEPGQSSGGIKLTSQEKLKREAFRLTLNADQKATMAIGNIMLHWASWDGDITQHIFHLKDIAEHRGIDTSSFKTQSLHKDRLSTLRRLVRILTNDKSQELRQLDTIYGIVAPLTNLRGSIAHGLMGLGNPEGTAEDLRLVVFSPGSDKIERVLLPSGHLDTPKVSEVFEAADQIWEQRDKLRLLVDALGH
jgi:hypothetical protein